MYKVIDTSSGTVMATIESTDFVVSNGLITFYESLSSRTVVGIFAITAGMLVAKVEKEKS